MKTENDKHNFLISTRVLIREIEEVQDELHRAISGNKKAARRARVSLVKIEKMGKLFRKVSLKHMVT